METTKPYLPADCHVYFIEATIELMEPDKLKKATVAGGVLYEVTAGGCWEVISHAPSGAGYARVRRQGKHYSLAQVAWEEKNGPIPSGMSVSQECGNRLCVNPEHLVLRTPAEIQGQAKTGRLPDNMEVRDTPLTPEQRGDIQRLLHFGASKRTIIMAYRITRHEFDRLRVGDVGLNPECNLSSPDGHHGAISRN